MKVKVSFDKYQSLDTIVRQENSVHILTPYCSQIFFNIILHIRTCILGDLFPLNFQTKILY
jgi:hypothetical protein